MTKKLNGNKIKRNFLIASVAFFTIIFSNMTVNAANESTSTAAKVDVSIQDTTAIPLAKVNRSTNATSITPPGMRPLGISPLSIYGYASKYTNTAVGQLEIYAPGSATSTGGATINTSDFSTDLTIYATLYRPDGSIAKSDIQLIANREVYISFTNAQPGTYVLKYTIYGVSKGNIRCWIY